MKYKLIKKWLRLNIINEPLANDVYCYVDADELEAKLAEGFEVFSNSSNYFTSSKHISDSSVALAIGKQPIKKAKKILNLKDK